MPTRRCHACGSEVEGREKIRRTDECPRCGRDLHVCRNCRHFDPGAHNQCREPVAEWVSDKERANFCDYFEFASGRDSAGSSRSSPQDAAREKWKKLFKD